MIGGLLTGMWTGKIIEFVAANCIRLSARFVMPDGIGMIIEHYV